jgi:hypothetical protein
MIIFLNKHDLQEENLSKLISVLDTFYNGAQNNSIELYEVCDSYDNNKVVQNTE